MLPTLVPQKERFPFFGLRNGIDRMFDDFFSSANDWPAVVEPRMAGPNVFLPPIDVKETDTSLLVEVEVPGFKSGDVDVQIEDGVLVLRGERKQEKEEKTKRWHRSSATTASSRARLLLPTTSTPRRSRRRARRASSTLCSRRSRASSRRRSAST